MVKHIQELNFQLQLHIHPQFTRRGMTLPNIVINIGDTEFAPGLTYVALSRARKLNDIMILKSYPKSRFDICAEKPSYILRNNFIKKYFSHTLN